MTSYDLTEAMQAVDAALEQNAPTWTLGDHELAEITLTAALPHLEQQIRHQIAADLEAEAANYAEPNGINPQEDGERIGLTRAADIARGATEGDTDHD